MKYFFTLSLIILLALTVVATQQIPDKILFNGKEYSLYTHPLDSFFKKKQGMGILPKTEVISSGLWRGYIATFEIKDNQLFVKDIEIPVWDTSKEEKDNITWRSVLNEVFPDQKEIKADWLSGLLVLPYGETTNYVNINYTSDFEKYFVIEIDNGSLKKLKKFDKTEFKQFREKQYNIFIKTGEYKEIKARQIALGYSNVQTSFMLKRLITEYTSKFLTE